jgi:hypothetical protein
MKDIEMKLMIRIPLILGLMGMVLISACKKTDDFKTKLDALPQINNENKYAYLPAYGVGDTMTIVGRLQPKNNLKIQIGKAEASIVSVDSIPYLAGTYPSTSQQMMDRVKIIITQAMGLGRDIPVKITSGGYSINGAGIEIYALGGKGSFSESLGITDHVQLSDPNNVFLQCINGKGDLYFFDVPSKSLKHISKDGNFETLMTQRQLTGNQFSLQAFVAGGLNPQSTKAWYSVKTATGDAFVEADLQSKTIKVLNQSNGLKAPFEGLIGQVNLAVTAVYPDSKGNVFLGIAGEVPVQHTPVEIGAVAKYSSSDGSLAYLFKTFAALPGMNGVYIEGPNRFASGLRILPDESTLYVLSTESVRVLGNITSVPSFLVFDLESRLMIKKFNLLPEGPSILPKRYTGPFSNLRINLDVGSTDGGFGYLPLPGQRLQFLLYQFLDGALATGQGGVDISALVGGPKWMVLDFQAERTYQYAPGPADITGYRFEPYYQYGKPASAFKDQLLNYDEQGQVYMTANGKRRIVKTVLK